MESNENAIEINALKEKLNDLERQIIDKIIKGVGYERKIIVLRKTVMASGYREWLIKLKKLEELKQLNIGGIDDGTK